MWRWKGATLSAHLSGHFLFFGPGGGPSQTAPQRVFQGVVSSLVSVTAAGVAGCVDGISADGVEWLGGLMGMFWLAAWMAAKISANSLLSSVLGWSPWLVLGCGLRLLVMLLAGGSASSNSAEAVECGLVVHNLSGVLINAGLSTW